MDEIGSVLAGVAILNLFLFSDSVRDGDFYKRRTQIFSANILFSFIKKQKKNLKMADLLQFQISFMWCGLSRSLPTWQNIRKVEFKQLLCENYKIQWNNHWIVSEIRDWFLFLTYLILHHFFSERWWVRNSYLLLNWRVIEIQHGA